MKVTELQEKMWEQKDVHIGKKHDSKLKAAAKEKMGMFSRSFFESIQVIVIALLVVVIIYMFIGSFNIVDGDSMEPNFESKELIISEKITTNFGTLQRGDVIVFASPIGKDFIKRIIGMPGEKIKIMNGQIYINGNLLNERYLSDSNKFFSGGTYLKDGDEQIIPDNNYFCMGDNRNASYDSRAIGPVDKSKIKGKAWVVFWPLDKFHIVSHEGY